MTDKTPEAVEAPVVKDFAEVEAPPEENGNAEAQDEAQAPVESGQEVEVSEPDVSDDFLHHSSSCERILACCILTGGNSTRRRMEP
jgi:hypothetical protein